MFLGSRLLLGLIYFVFGLNGFLNFIPQPPLPETAMGFLGGLMSASYFFPFLKATEVISGIALLTGRFSALALIVLAPITIQIFLFHAVLTPGVSNLVLPLVMVVLSLITAYSYGDKYAPLLKAK
ncbi:MAG: acyltransferase [Bdellovibrionaceae bacterium]|nr:acyltransferase [Pseudobdellovibrionaceae bacterium]